ncbi:hypothetical protein DES53_11585 [Roseimicrobium gellanilyticum]|uniref:Uncharacterized protein n=1 Tax=Roseimicrobium gellanilyticum TaxID=748857 RepID=A0A366H4K5_9BACT|nr:hypothetical protein [Roseimicrobium gellanilyticum]RBP36944.1 hypothetical protein DES53_11585 [Roseimicrobium gellanilyticum]
MSRRTKRTLLCLIFVLLVVPISYVALTWTVTNPLRFRYVGQGKPERHREEGIFESTEALMVPIYLEAENTSHASLRLYRCWLIREVRNDPSDTIFTPFGMDQLSPGDTLRRELHVPPDVALSLVGKEMLMDCDWDTTTREYVRLCMVAVARWLRFLFEYNLPLPAVHHDLIPVEHSGIDTTTPGETPLDMPNEVPPH